MGAREVFVLNWRAALELGRVSNLPTVWTNVLAGIALAGGVIAPTVFASLALSLSFFYVGGMYLNDAFDRETDAVQRRTRPIPSGRASARTVFLVGFALLFLGNVGVFVVAGGAHSPRALHASLSGLALALLIVFYDVYHKNNPISPVVMGLCRVGVYVTAALAVVPLAMLHVHVIIGALALLSYLIGLSYVAKQESLAEVKGLWPLVFLFAPFVLVLPHIHRSYLTAAVYVGFFGWVVFALSFLFRKKKRNIPRAVVSFIAGISLLDALFLAALGQEGAVIVCAIAFVLTLFMQRYIPGT